MSVNLHKSERIAVIGHDLVGSISGIEPYRSSRITPTVILGDDVPADIDVIGVTGMSKIMTPRMAYRRTRKTINRCRGRLMFFYENGFLKGNMGPDSKAIIDELQPEKLIICIAWPEMNVFTVDATSYFGKTPVHHSENALDAVTPVRESYIPAIIQRYTDINPLCINTDDIELGCDYISRLVNTSSQRIIVFDAVRQEHLNTIATAVLLNRNKWTAIGYGGLIRSIPYVLGNKEDNRSFITLPNEKPVLLILGSLVDSSAVELAIAAEQGMVYPLLVEPSEFLIKKRRERRIMEIANEAGKAISNGQNVAITSTYSRFIPQLRKITAYLLASIAKLVVEQNETGAVITRGADTSYAFCKTMDIARLEIQGHIPVNGRLPVVVKASSVQDDIYYQCLLGGLSEDEFTLVRSLKLLRQY
jgi:uncharacterized protein YgbK (DUF1537 family)